MLRGLATINLFADDMEKARDWYTEVLGIGPYFARPESGPPSYLEYRVGDYEHELGIIDKRFSPHPDASGPGGAITYWHVDDVEAAVQRMISLGATPHEDVTTRGPGFVTASVVDPFGNVLGVMYNAHYLEILEFRSGSMLGE